ncbi:hypothetical protein [Halopelagius fulvigenes]|uniref:Uncharacterized protein n=1 Tax=Halopelagius fulvigenes TaxID=1198324 RepID=A0ABD5U137_9EURY
MAVVRSRRRERQLRARRYRAHRVRAFDAASGDVAWERELDGGVYGSPTLGFGGRRRVAHLRARMSNRTERQKSGCPETISTPDDAPIRSAPASNIAVASS